MGTFSFQLFMMEKQDLEKDDTLISNVLLQLVNFIQKWDGDFFDYEKWANALGHIKGGYEIGLD